MGYKWFTEEDSLCSKRGFRATVHNFDRTRVKGERGVGKENLRKTRKGATTSSGEGRRRFKRGARRNKRRIKAGSLSDDQKSYSFVKGRLNSLPRTEKPKDNILPEGERHKILGSNTGKAISHKSLDSFDFTVSLQKGR